MHETNDDQLFQGLVFQYQQLTMMALGKISRPDGGMQRNLQEASLFIDMLAMLQNKTKGNLNETLSAFLDRTLADLRLNYVDESRRPEEGEDAPASGDDKASE